jgi:hypothetical protein
MTIFAKMEAQRKNISTAIIPLVHSMAQNTATSDDDIVSFLCCMDETVIMKLATINSLIAKVAHETVNKVTGKRLKLLRDVM